MIVRTSCTNRKGKVPQWQIMQITCRSILGYPTTPTFSSSLRMCAVKKKKKNYLAIKDLGKSFKKPKTLTYVNKKTVLEKINEKDSQKKFFTSKNFLGKKHKSAI